MDAKEVGAAQDDERHPRRDLGGDQPTVLASAREEKLEPGKMVRLDSTVTAALMHEPSDSSLLWDGVRVMVRLLKAADALIGGAGVPWRDHRRAAKKRARAIESPAADRTASHTTASWSR